MTKEEITKDLLSKAKTSKNIIIEWATGVGKTKAAFEVCKLWGCKKILVLVAETAHIKNWQEEQKKWKFKPYLDIYCYASLHKFIDTEWDCIILDESHHSDTDIRMECLTRLIAQHTIALSATLSQMTKFNLEATFGKFYTHSVSIKQAIEWGILPKPNIHVFTLTLDKKNYTETIVYTRGLKSKYIEMECNYLDRWSILKNKSKYPNIKLTIHCTPYQKYLYITEQIEYYKNKYMCTRNIVFKNKWMKLGSDRKIFLGELKTEYARRLLQTLEGKKYICFCTSIAQSEALDRYHSINSTKKNNQSLIDDFNAGLEDKLFAVGMAKEGLNLTNIEAAVLIQLDGNDIAFIQKTGRALRAKEPDVYIFYFKDTRDKDYLDIALETINKEYIVYEDMH